MAVSLWDTTRPVGLFGGVGAGSVRYWQVGGSMFWFSLILGLVAGLIAFWLSDVFVRRVVAQWSEAALFVVCLTTFSGIVVAALVGSWLGSTLARLA